MARLLFALILSCVAQELRTDGPASLAETSPADQIKGIKTKLNTLRNDHKTRLYGVDSEFQEALSRERSGLEKAANKVKTGYDANLQLAQQEVLNGKKEILEELPLAKKAGIHWQNVNAMTEKRIETTDAQFEKDSSTHDIKWNKEVANLQQINMKRTAILEQRAAKKMMAETKRASKLEVTSAKMLQKLEKRNTKQLKKSDKKFQKLENELADAVGDAEVVEDTLDGMLEQNEDLAAKVEESPDPELPGLEQAQETKEERVEEYEEFGEEHLEALADHYKDILDDMRYGYEDHKITAQDAVAEGVEKLGDIMERYQDKLKRLVDGLKDRNTGGLEETKSETQILVGQTRTMTAALIKAQEQVRKMQEYWKNTFEKARATEQKNLDQGVRETQDKMEQKFGELNQYIVNIAASANSDMLSKVKLVEGDGISELNKGGNWIKNNLAAVIEQLTQLGQQSAKMAEQMESVHKGIAKQDQLLTSLTGIPSQIKAANAKAVSDAHSMITSGQDTSKAAAAQSNQMAYETIEGVLTTLNAEGEAINKESQELTSMVGASAGKAAEALAAVGKKGRDDMAAVKGELSLLEIKLEDNRQLFAKTLEALKTIPPIMKMESANTVGELTDIGFKASNFKQSLLDPMVESIKGTSAHTTDMMMGAQEKVTSALTESSQRITDRIRMLDDKTHDLQGLQEKMHADKSHRQSMNEERLTDVRKEAYETLNNVAKDFEAINSTIKDHKVTLSNSIAQHDTEINGIKTTYDQGMTRIQNEFRKLLGDGLGEYGDAISRASKQMDVTLVNVKSAIQTALAGDQLSFRKNMGGAQDELEQLRRYQAALRAAIDNSKGTEALEKASAGLVLAGRASSSIAELIKQMDAKAHVTAEKASGLIDGATGDLDPERAALENMVRSSLAALGESSSEMEKAMLLKLTKVTGQLGATGQEIRGNNADMDRYLLGEERDVHEKAALLSQMLATAQGKVSAGYRGDLVKLTDAMNRMMGESDRMEGNSRLTAEIAAREGAATDSDVEKAEAAIMKLLGARLGSSADTDSAVVQGLVGQLADVFKTETDQSDKLGHEATVLAQHLAERVDVQTQQGLQQISKFEPLIAKQEALSDKYFRDLNDVVLETHGDMERLAESMVELAYQVKVAVEAKAHGRVTAIDDLEKQVGQMEEMRKYASADALEKVIEAVKEGAAESQTITEMLNADVKPASRNFRMRIGQVFQDMGMSLDIDKVNSMANATMAEEISLRERLINNRQNMEEMMENVNAAMHANLTAVYHETRNLIDQVKGMDHLSLAEKQQRIREIKAEARRKTSMIMARGRSMINQQMKAMRVMEEKSRESTTLLSRAKSLASGTFLVTDRKHIQEGMGGVAQKMEALRDKYASPFESSLLEEYEELSDDPNSYRRHAPQHFAEIAGNLGFLQQARAADDAALEQQLRSLGAVLK